MSDVVGMNNTTTKKDIHLLKIHPYGNTDKEPILFSVIIKDDYKLPVWDGFAHRCLDIGDEWIIQEHEGLHGVKTYKTINLAKRSLKKHLQTNFTGWDGGQFIIYGNSTIKRGNKGNGAYILGVIYS